MSDTETTRMMGIGGGTIMPGSDRTQILNTPNLGVTGQMPSGGADAYRTQMGGTTVCPVCKSTTSMLDPYCGDCGFLLTSTPAEAGGEIPMDMPPLAELADVNTGRRYTLRAGANTVGRQGTDVLMDDGTVSRNHARITLENGSVTVEDLGSSNGTKVGDTRLGPNQPTPAAPGTILKFGNVRLTLEMNAGNASASSGSGDVTIALGGDRTILGDDRTIVGQPPVGTETGDGRQETGDAPTAAPLNTQPSALNASSVAMLRKTEGPGSDIPITGGVISIGRRAGNTLVVSGDAYISGRHAELTTDNSGTYLTDVGSTNGTVLNGSKIPANEKQMLIDGDEVQLGQTKYKFELMELAPESDTTASDVYAEGAGMEPLPNHLDNGSHAKPVPELNQWDLGFDNPPDDATRTTTDTSTGATR